MIEYIGCHDCHEYMRNMIEQSMKVDAIITDPPYMIGGKARTYDSSGSKKNKKMEHEWDDYTLDEYLEEFDMFLKNSKQILKPNGVIAMFGSYHNTGLLNYLYQRNSILITNQIAIFKVNAMPNLACTRLTASHEDVLVGVMDKKHTFNYTWAKHYSYDKDPYLKEDKQMRDVWIDTILDQKESLQEHPAQKKKEWLYRLVQIYTNPGDIVFDPYGGLMTTAVVCKENDRQFICLDNVQKYVDLGKYRLAVGK